jgi:hypothetical protein
MALTSSPASGEGLEILLGLYGMPKRIRKACLADSREVQDSSPCYRPQAVEQMSTDGDSKPVEWAKAR